MTDKRRVVITGIGAVTPLGVGARQLHEQWSRGVSGISEKDGLTEGAAQAGGFCESFDAAEHLSVKEARRLDRFAQLAVVAADEAAADAGFAGGLPYDPMRIGLIMATGIGGFTTVQANLDAMREKGAGRISPLGIPMYMPNAAAAAISMRHGIQGQAFAVASACASSG
ncbi:MAG: 3-oxoacyl-ACP synthase, partial [Conexibacteraceae bacterium]|nr:3-oxoacyl-ACP synthase [Conexibacteraceae bacterium]